MPWRSFFSFSVVAPARRCRERKGGSVQRHLGQPQIAVAEFEREEGRPVGKQFQKDVEVYNDTVGCSVVMTVQSQIDMLVHGIVTKVNDALCPNKELTLADGTTIKVLDEDKSLIGDDKNSTMVA